MKKDMFSDLGIGDSSKYKDFNEKIALEERAAALDEKIEAASKKAKTVSWAHEILEFYEHTKSVDSDILGMAMNSGLLEQIKRDADYVIAKDNQAQEAARAAAEAKAKAEREARAKAEAEAKIKAEREARAKAEAAEREAERARIEAEQAAIAKKAAEAKKINDDAREADERIAALEDAKRSIYWCDDVYDTDKFVNSISSKSRVKCKNLSTLDLLKEETESIKNAYDIDKKIKDLAKAEEKSKKWCDAVGKIKIDSDCAKYVNEKKLLETLQAAAKKYSAQIKAEAAADAEAKAEKERREAKERELAAKNLAAKKKRQAAKERRKKRVPYVLGIVVIIALALVAWKLENIRYYAVGAATGVLLFIAATLTFIKKPNTEASVHVVCLISSAAVIPLMCISDDMRKAAFCICVSLFVNALTLFIYRQANISRVYDSARDAAVFQILVSGTLLSVSASVLFLDGITRYIVMGVAIFAVALAFGIISVAVDVDYEARESFGIIASIAVAVCGVAFLFVSRGFTVLAICLIASSPALLLGGLLNGCDDDCWGHAFWFAIPLGVAFLVLFLNWGYTDYIIRDNVLVHYYGEAETFEVPSGITEIGDNCIKGAAKRKMKNVIIPKDVVTIGKEAFQKCKKLENLVFEEDSALETIGVYAFYDCANLKNTLLGNTLMLPKTLKTIGSYAFSYTKISTIAMDINVEYIGSSVFSYSGLKTLVYNGTRSDWDKIKKPEGGFWEGNWKKDADFELVYES